MSKNRLGRPPKSKIAHQIYRIIKENPGISESDLMRKLGKKKVSGVEAFLAACESNRLFLCEDSDERLYTWTITDSEKGEDAYDG